MISRTVIAALFFCAFSVFAKDATLLTSPENGKSLTQEKNEIQEGPSPSSTVYPKEGSTDDDVNSLAEALRVLRRRKREISRAHKPYSSYRPLGTHRYRYPLYRKRAAYYTPDYYDGEDPYNNEVVDYPTYMSDAEKPSLFRERERGPIPELISNAHFSSKSAYHKRRNPNSPSSSYVAPTNTHFNLETAPYDLNIMGKLYELGKRAENSPTKSRHLDVPNHYLANLNAANGRIGTKHYFPDEVKDRTYTNMLKNVVDEASLRNSMIRRKRASNPNVSHFTRAVESNKTDNKSYDKFSAKHNPNSIQKLATDRQKRAYEDTSLFFTPNEDENDFLTREYFKTIARSVGNKRKRMAYAKFEAQKRSNTFDAFLENPQMLHYVQEQIRDAEEEVAKDAENEIKKNSQGYPRADLTAQVLLSNSIAKLDALERMRESLYQLEHLQEQEIFRKKGQDLMKGFSEDDVINEQEKEKRRKALRGRLIREGQLEEEEERQKRMKEDDIVQKRREEEVEDEREKRKEQALRNLIKGNRRDDCPVLERIVINCIAVTEMVDDEGMVFLEPCLRHEVCYMCGSGLDVTRHECDALLSSALEAGCNDSNAITGQNQEGSLDCLSAAGETYNILGDASRYDDKGTCTFDPCVRQLIDSK